MVMNWLKSVSFGGLRLPSSGTGTFRFGIAGAPRMSLFPSRGEYDDAIADAERSSLIMICVEWIASMFPLATWELQQKVDDAWTPVDDHPVLGLLESPTPWQGGADLLAASMVDWNLYGEGYWLLVGPGKEPQELWWRPASSMTPKLDRNGYLSHYEYRVDGQVVRLETDDVFQFRRRQSPDNPWRGVSPLQSLGKEIWTDTQAAIYSAAMAKNLGMPGWIASPKVIPEDSDVSATEIETTRDYLRDEYAGENRGKPMVTSIPMDIHRMAFNPEEMHLDGLHNFSEQRVTGMFRLPAAVVGFGTGLEQTTENATLVQYEKQAWQTGLKPIHRSMSSQVSRGILPLFGLDVKQWRLRFNFDDIEVLQEDQDKSTDRNVKRLSAGGMTRYEFRESEGLDVDDLDKVWLMKSSITEVPAPGFPESVLAEREAKAADMAAMMQPNDDDDDDDDDDEEDPSDDDNDSPPTRSVHLRRLSNSDRLLSRYHRSTRRITDDFTDLLTDEFNGLGRLAARHFREINSQRSSTRQLSSDDEDMIREIVEAMSIRDWQNEVLRQKIGEPLTLRTLTAAVDDISATLDIAVNIPDQVMRRVIADGGTQLLGIDVAGQTRNGVFSALHDGRANGEGVDALARRIRDNVSRGRFATPQIRARNIARTETMHAQNVSTMTAYEHIDEISRVEARDNQIGFDDEDCSERDGQIFSIAEAKAISDHPNGTLLWLPVVN